jgi:hypothetical protein
MSATPITEGRTVEALQHVPIIPPREGLEEAIYAARWATHTLSNGDHPIHAALSAYPHPIGQREAHVAASFACWLGTNLGKAFLHRGGILKAHMAAQEAYVAAWAVQNHRKSAVNHGQRTLEHLAADSFSPVNGIRYPSSEPSARDYEVADHMAAWIGSYEGGEFLRRCTQDVERDHRERRMRHNLTVNHGLSDSAADAIVKNTEQGR